MAQVSRRAAMAYGHPPHDADRFTPLEDQLSLFSPLAQERPSRKVAHSTTGEGAGEIRKEPSTQGSKSGQSIDFRSFFLLDATVRC